MYVIGFIKKISIYIVYGIILCCLGTNLCQAEPSDKTEILWDTWGIPHIYGKSHEDLFYAFGWSQMHSHGDLILRLYGQARGRAAEYWGAHYAASDEYVHTMGVPERSPIWYADQSPDFRKNLDAFAKGINDYAKKHGDLLADSVKVVLPISGVDLLSHAQRALNLTFVASRVRQEARRWESLGSNAWAVAPSRSESGHALLLTNPHLPWEHQFMFYEAHLIAPEVDTYGAALVGWPVLVVAFNNQLGWTHTVNTFDGLDLYELTRSGNGYEWDGAVKDFDLKASVIKIKQPDGSLREKELKIFHSVHGPVLSQKDGKLLAARMVGLDTPKAWEQWWDMGRAKNLAEFERVLKRIQIPMFNLIYADKDGHIMYLYNGQVPIRSEGDVDYWRGIVPGHTSSLLWTKTHPYGDLPKVLDPPNGWVQNCNDPPWTSTLPMVLNPKDFPAYLSPEGLRFRQQRSIRLLQDNDRMTLDEMVIDKHDTQVELADHVLDDLIRAARQYGGPVAKEAATVFEAWDRQVNADSRGAVLFEAWFQAVRLKFSTPFKADQPLDTPNGLAEPEVAVVALEKAAKQVKQMYGSLDIPWGEVYRIRYAGKDLPANGGRNPLGVFRVLDYEPETDGKFKVISGDAYVAAIEFSTPVRAQALLSYGNATQSHSSHVGDQLNLLGQKKLRTVWRTRKEIEKNLEYKESF